METLPYLQRINFSGDTAPTLQNLMALQRAHTLAIPFENLDIHRGVEIRLDLDRIYQKIIVNRRGGFCYELNGLFFELITAFGFRARRISAAVYNDTKQVLGPDFDHLTTIVEIDGVEYLSDVGFGSFPMTPLPIHSGQEIEDPLGVFTIQQFDDLCYDVKQKTAEKEVLLYRFHTEERAYQEFAGMCHYQQTSPDSHFTQKRLISLKTPDGRVTITGNLLKLTTNGKVTEQLLEGEAAFNQALQRYFAVVL